MLPYLDILLLLFIIIIYIFGGALLETEVHLE